jgi:hypothetical protein
MKKLILLVVLAFIVLGQNRANGNPINTELPINESASINIKIKNDTDDEMDVYNAGGGGSYRLQKNIIVTIKMDAGDKLYVGKNKSGKLLLTASDDMNNKVQLVSKL